MVDYTNKDYITSLSATNTTDGVKDGTDHIHSGLIKVLAQASRGNYVVSYGGSNFQQVTGVTRTKFQFSGAIKYKRDGRIYTGTPTAVELTSDADSANDRYDIIVIAGSALQVREGTASTTPRVPDILVSGDIPVAMVKVVGGTDPNVITRPVQLYGYNKTVLSESIDKIYNTAGSEVMGFSGTDISFYGSTNVGAIQMERAEGSKPILHVKNTGGEAGAVIEGQDGTITNPVLDVKYGGASKGSIDGNGDLSIAGSLIVGSNIIKASDSGSTITMDTDDNVVIGGDLTISGGDLIGPTNNDFAIRSDGNMSFRIDADNDETSQSFTFINNAATTIATLTEAGHLTINNSLVVSGGSVTYNTAPLKVNFNQGLTISTFQEIENLGTYKASIQKYFQLQETGAGTVISAKPTIQSALDPSNVIDPNTAEVFYIGISAKNQILNQEWIASGGVAHSDYAVMLEGKTSPTPTNGLVGGGAFVHLANPSTYTGKRLTLSNIANVPMFVFCVDDPNLPHNIKIQQCWHKGFDTRDNTGTIYNAHTVNLSNCITQNHIAGGIPDIDGNPLYEFPLFAGNQSALLLRPNESITIQAVRNSSEEEPSYEVEQFHGEYFNDTGFNYPLSFWKVIGSTSNNLNAKVSTITANSILGQSQSGSTIIADVSPCFIGLPHGCKIGTSFFIFAKQACTVQACNNIGGGHLVATGNAIPLDVIRTGTSATAQTDALAAFDMATYLKINAVEWLKVG